MAECFQLFLKEKIHFQIFHRGTPFVKANVANPLLTEIAKDCQQVGWAMMMRLGNYEIGQ